MDPPAIVREIRRNLDFLSLSPQDRPGRHQSMAAVFAYTWQLLAASEQDTLAQLAVFSGPFSLEAAMAIGAATPLAVARLLDMSLLQRRRDGRYELHELLHQFVNQRLNVRFPEMARRHCDYYLELVAAQERAFYGPQPRQAVAVVQAELSNIRQAWQWAAEHEYRPAIERSLEAVGRFYQTAALLQEGEAMFALAAPALGEAPSLQARLMVWQAYFLLKLGRQVEAVRLARQALAQSDGDALAQAEAYSLLGEVLDRDRQLEPAKAYLEQALAAFAAQSDLERLARSLRRMVQARWRSGELEEARRYLQRAVPIHQSLGDKKGLAQLYNLMAGIHYERNEVPQALAYVQQAKQLYEDIGDRLDAAVVAANLARLYTHLGRYEEALASNLQALDTSRELGDRHGLARDLSNRGRILLILGDFESSLDFYFRALDVARALDDRARIGDFQAGAAAVYAAQGDQETALTYFDLALPALREQGIPYHLAGPLLGKAELLYGRGELGKARSLCEEARELAAVAEMPEYVWRGRLLSAKLDYAAGEESAGLRQLADMLAEAEDDDARAELNYELWRMTGERSWAEAAESGYRRAYASRPTYVNRSRIEELRRLLATELKPASLGAAP
jgi:tetratricopeptide (TPR) repeat protein